MAEHLDGGQRRRGSLIFRLQCRLPIGVVWPFLALAGVAPEIAPAGLGVHVKMSVNEPGMHDCTMSRDFSGRLPRSGNICVRADGDDDVATNGDCSVCVDGTIGIERQDASVSDEDVASLLRRNRHSGSSLLLLIRRLTAPTLKNAHVNLNAEARAFRRVRVAVLNLERRLEQVFGMIENAAGVAVGT